MLSENSIGFKTLFEANSNAVIQIEGIRDRTMELAISYCHGIPFKDHNYEDTFSLFFFSDSWEIPDLKVCALIWGILILE